MFKYRNWIILVLLFFWFAYGSAQKKPFEVPDYSGEIMFYRLKYGIFNVGVASISSLPDSPDSAIHIMAGAKTTGWVKIFKDLDYSFESYMNPATGFPVSAIRNLEDGNYKVYNELIFDHHSNKDSTIIFSQLSGKHVVPKDIYDILTGFFCFRKNFISSNMSESEDVVIKTYFTDELWDLRIRYAGEETIKTAYGEKLCYKFNPVTVIGRYFRNDDDMTVWFTQDPNHIPIRVKLNLRFGSISGELDEYLNPDFRLLKTAGE